MAICNNHNCFYCVFDSQRSALEKRLPPGNKPAGVAVLKRNEMSCTDWHHKMRRSITYYCTVEKKRDVTTTLLNHAPRRMNPQLLTGTTRSSFVLKVSRLLPAAA